MPWGQGKYTWPGGAHPGVFLHSLSYLIPLPVSIQASPSHPLPQPALRFWDSLDKFPVPEVS